jgi:hypothetical protein
VKSLATLFAFLWIACVVLPLRAADPFPAGESLGKITLGQKEAALLQLLGKPGSKGKETLWEATGDWVEEWKFPAHGLDVAMASRKKGGAKTVASITATSNCKLATARGIAVGSSLAAVRKAYGEVESKAESRPGESFVAGSIYGGVIFTLKNGKVTGIFIGAAAE